MALLEGHPPCFIFRQLFINQLPESLQVQMATVTFTEAREFALVADKFWDAKVAADASSPLTISRVRTRSPKMRRRPAPANPDGLCFYHAKFGSKATNCRHPCSFLGNDRADRQ